MDQIGWIRRFKVREGKSEREIARMAGLSRNTVAKWLRTDTQSPKYRSPAGRCELTPFEEQLAQVLGSRPVSVLQNLRLRQNGSSYD